MKKNNARWLRSVPEAQWKGYDSSLGRFTQADSIVPSGIQGYDRYAYANNSPIQYADPTGHSVDCEIGKGCAKDPKPIEEGNNGGLSGCGIQCTEDDFNNATLNERLEWFNWLQGQMNEVYGNGTSDWFNNVATIVEGFAVTGQDGNQWVVNVDANILITIQNGFAASVDKYNGAIGKGTSVDRWKVFFENINSTNITLVT